MSAQSSPLPGKARVARASVGESVTEVLREMIFDGQLAGGQRIPQDDIAAELGVSRLPVREAIATLENDGLVEVEKHRGAYVLAIQRIDVQDHYETFGHVHGIAAKRAAGLVTAEHLGNLEDLDKQMHETEDVNSLHDLNWKFHRVINVVGGSRRLQSVILGLTRQIPRSFRYSIPPATPAALAEHRAILDALKTGDGEAAAQACITHLRSESTYIIGTLEQRGFFAEEPETA